MRVLLVDNYDSFTYNLAQLLTEAGCRHLDTLKNDKIDPDKMADYDKIVFSPGPGLPEEVPVMGDILSRFGKQKSILGVCLGHQAIGCFYGAQLQNLSQPVHGISSLLDITDKGETLFNTLQGKIIVGRYHSWVIDPETLPLCLKVTSVADDGCIMSVAHTDYDVKGIQFHPESYISLQGMVMMKNWLSK